MNVPSKKSKLEIFAETILQEGPGCVSIVLAVILVGSVLGLALFDPIVGAKAGEYLTGSAEAGWLLSLATTAIIMIPFAGVAYIIAKNSNKSADEKMSGWAWAGIVGVLVVAIAAASFDVYFDGLALDVYRWGKFIDPNVEILDAATRQGHQLGRWAFRLISVIGDAGAGLLLGLFPILYDLFRTLTNQAKGNSSSHNPAPAQRHPTPAEPPSNLIAAADPAEWISAQSRYEGYNAFMSPDRQRVCFVAKSPAPATFAPILRPASSLGHPAPKPSHPSFRNLG